MSLKTLIGTLSRDEKLQAMELLWQDLTADSRSFASPVWHEAVVANRLSNPATGSALPLDMARSEIKEAMNARRASD